MKNTISDCAPLGISHSIVDGVTIKYLPTCEASRVITRDTNREDWTCQTVDSYYIKMFTQKLPVTS